MLSNVSGSNVKFWHFSRVLVHMKNLHLSLYPVCKQAHHVPHPRIREAEKHVFGLQADSNSVAVMGPTQRPRIKRRASGSKMIGALSFEYGCAEDHADI